MAQMISTANNKGKSPIAVWICLVVILVFALFLRLADIWRTESIDYHPDEDKIARPVFSIADNAQVGLKSDYNWPVCGVIYPLGYSLYALKGWFGPYSYEEILVLQRILSALFGTAVVFMGFLLIRKLFSVQAALLASALIAIAKLPVMMGNNGLMRSIVPFTILTIMVLSYDLFEVNQGHDKADVKEGKCCVIGFLCGWGIAVRWTLLLAAIPLSGAFLLGAWFSRKLENWKTFVKINIQRIAIIAVIAILSFLAANPDFQLAPKKVLSGMMLHKQQGKVGHYGRFSDRSDSLVYKLSNLSKNMSNCGSIYLFLPGIFATIFCLIKPTRPKIFLIWTMVLWLVVVHRSVLPLERYHLVPFIMMLFLISIWLGDIIKNSNRWLRVTAITIYALIITMGSLYTLIYISPYWRTDARIQCSSWIKANVPRGSGVTWAPRTHKWMAPGMVVEPSLFRAYPRIAETGKAQYMIAAKRIMDIFKEHPPSKPVDPKDWFPSKPPTMNELIIYAEMNAGGGPNLEFIKEFKTKPQFLGLDLRLFGQSPDKDTTIANQSVSLFKLNRTPGPEIGK